MNSQDDQNLNQEFPENEQISTSIDEVTTVNDKDKIAAFFKSKGQRTSKITDRLQKKFIIKFYSGKKKIHNI